MSPAALPLLTDPLALLGPGPTIPVLTRGDVVAELALPVGVRAATAAALALTRELATPLEVRVGDRAILVRVTGQGPVLERASS